MVPETGIEPVRPLCRKAADFKSDVSTNFTTRAHDGIVEQKRGCRSQITKPWQANDGGATRSRTGLLGFAIRCITALLSRHVLRSRRLQKHTLQSTKKGSLGFPLWNLEREKSLELSTSTLARLRSTN